MPKTLYTPEEARRAKNISNARFDKANTKHFGLKFNIKTDADILERISQQKSFQTYIKDLIRADIARSGQQ